ncbi:MAG TPA: choice-of-anchor tandem repeat GloVer-containing protein, partial [Verrucomicrobiae bacterium]|nr:choice-of-anchor tandem repeat GloVer-containing protein [Verrucomicrobiae bacterium]
MRPILAVAKYFSAPRACLILVLSFYPGLGYCSFTITNLARFTNAYALSLTPGRDGSAYGEVSVGGNFGNGMIFRMSPSGVLTTVVSLPNMDGAYPYGGLVQGTDGNLYGVGTPLFGQTNSVGNVFQVTTNGSFRVLATFSKTNGVGPASPLVQGLDSAFYGTASYGGPYTNVYMGSVGYGSIFRVDTNGALTILHAFDRTNGANPVGEMVQDKEGALFGSTCYGGAYDLGAVWKLDKNGTFTLLGSFDGTNGSTPLGGLMRGKDGNLYGTTRVGGTNLANRGSIFRLSLNGTLAPLAAFNGINGKWPMVAPTQGADGNLYGTTYTGGQFGSSGVVFTFTPPANLATVVETGWGLPSTSKLVSGPNGSFYGVSEEGTGRYTWVFSITPTAGENLTDPARATADDDGDKLSNLLEYALATDLQNPADPQEGLVAST